MIYGEEELRGGVGYDLQTSDLAMAVSFPKMMQEEATVWESRMSCISDALCLRCQQDTQNGQLEAGDGWGTQMEHCGGAACWGGDI